MSPHSEELWSEMKKITGMVDLKGMRYRGVKMRVFHQNESCLSCLNPPSSYEGRREQERQLSFWWKTLNLIGHYGNLRKLKFRLLADIFKKWQLFNQQPANLSWICSESQRSYKSIKYILLFLRIKAKVPVPVNCTSEHTWLWADPN